MSDRSRRRRVAAASRPRLIFCSGTPGMIEIHRLAVDVLAELRDAGRARAQHGVGSRRAVSADHLDRLFAADLAIDLPQQVEQMRVHVGLLFLAPVAHEPVELLQRGLVVAAIALEGDGDVFAGMDVMERTKCGCRLRRRRFAANGPRRTGTGWPCRAARHAHQDMTRNSSRAAPTDTVEFRDTGPKAAAPSPCWPSRRRHAVLSVSVNAP